MPRSALPVLLIAVFVLFLASCSGAPKVAVAADAAAQNASGPISAKPAFWDAYKSAHSWAHDLVPIAIESKSAAADGKAQVWAATFASPSKHQARIFTYAATAQPPDLFKGVNVGRVLNWGGPSAEAMPFFSDDFSVDSEAAYKTALSKADPWLKKHPDKPVSLALGNASRFNGPVWYVLWGTQKDGYAVYVSAKTGEVVK
ncbi:MAG TPA: hypothetical protein VFR84_17370 [Candidatus Angelobacter sp.]|nr:hypothetical protein [Candidatus Angelobacter sp.]